MRNLDTEQYDSTQGARREPNYLVEIDINGIQKWATSKQHEDFSPGPILVGDFSGSRGVVWVWNEDYKYTEEVIAGSFLGNEVKISWAYDGDPINVFSGIIEMIDIEDGEWLRISCDREGPKKYPLGRFLAPEYNHLPTPGYSIEFDGSSITIGD